jgi:hypothetical protein
MGDAGELPARLRFRDMARDLGFSHAGVMLKRHGGDRSIKLGAAAVNRMVDAGRGDAVGIQALASLPHIVEGRSDSNFDVQSENSSL